MPRTLGKATIVSMWPRPLSKRMPYMEWEIEAAPSCEKHGHVICGECLPYVKSVVTDRPQGRDIGNRESVQIIIDAQDIAADLIRDGYAMFVLEGDVEPTKAQLSAARDKVVEYFVEALGYADKLWNQYQDVKLLPESARIACAVLGIKRDWLTDTAKKRQCESCGDFVPIAVVKCKCGAIYDWQRAFELGMLTDKQEQLGVAQGKIVMPEVPEPVKRGPGRPPKEAAL